VNAPAVSVVVAACRSDAYLDLALRSALAQTFADFEVIVSDDANSPATRRVVESLGDGRVSYRSNSAPLGPAGNHRAAFRAARSELAAILNHDDVWEPGFLAALVPPLQKDPALVLAFCDHGVIDGAGRLLPADTAANTAKWGRDRLAAGPHRPFTSLVVAQTLPIAMGAVFRKSVADDLPDEAGPAYDLWFGYALARTGQAAQYIPERLSHWRVHSQSLSAGQGLAWSEGCAFCWRAMAADPAFAAVRRAARRKLSRAYISAAQEHLRGADRAAARRCARRAWSADPAAWKAPAAWALSFLPRSLIDRLTQ
jgi:glycosyltransferase involved in cell wall biosynthesis